MKTIGLIGGTGWVSTSEYYKIINNEVNNRLGGLHFAKCIIYSLNYAEINSFNQKKDSEGLYTLILEAAQKLSIIGADGIVLCANTLHQFVDRLESVIDKPLIHIADATSVELNKSGFNKVGLLGTKQTMEMDFYSKRMEKYNINIIKPEIEQRNLIQEVITNELLKSIFKKESRDRFLQIMSDLVDQGAQAIILGCTEIPLLISQDDTKIKVFDTLSIHAKAAVDFALD